jgi:hypothetical protein
VTAADRPDEYRIALAVYLTAYTRGPAPAIALGLARGDWLPEAVRDRLSDLESALRRAGSGTIADLMEIATSAWDAVGITSGRRPWRRTCLDFAALARPLQALPPSESAIAALVERAEARRAAVLVDFDSTHTAPVQFSISTVQLRC